MAASSTCAKVVSKPRPSRLSTQWSKSRYRLPSLWPVALASALGILMASSLVSVCGLPLMSWSILAFDHAPSVAHIVIACSDEKRTAVQEGVLGKLVLHKPVHFATSGATRQESVYNALQVVPAGYDFVSVHDAVRPLIEVETIEQGHWYSSQSHLRLREQILAHRATDTLKRVDGATIVDTPDRSTFWLLRPLRCSRHVHFLKPTK